jgi:hypothetical protein
MALDYAAAWKIDVGCLQSVSEYAQIYRLRPESALIDENMDLRSESPGNSHVGNPLNGFEFRFQRILGYQIQARKIRRASEGHANDRRISGIVLLDNRELYLSGKGICNEIQFFSDFGGNQANI